MTIQVLIADDHCVVAEGLRYLVQAQADMEVIACVQDGRGGRALGDGDEAGCSPDGQRDGGTKWYRGQAYNLPATA
jgi:hypothetical protein